MLVRTGWMMALTLVLAACGGEPEDTDAGAEDAGLVEDGYLACGEACDACSLGYCVAGGGSGHCSDPERQRCIIDAVDCDALRACVAGPPGP
jgi:hypothetical protein